MARKTYSVAARVSGRPGISDTMPARRHVQQPATQSAQRARVARPQLVMEEMERSQAPAACPPSSRLGTGRR